MKGLPDGSVVLDAEEADNLALIMQKAEDAFAAALEDLNINLFGRLSIIDAASWLRAVREEVREASGRTAEKDPGAVPPADAGRNRKGR